MILVGLKTESTMVNVRIDDLDANECKKVCETIRLLQAISARIDAETVFGVLVGLISFVTLVILVGLVAGSKISNVPLMISACLLVGIFLGSISGRYESVSLNAKNLADFLTLHNHIRQSQRCGELYTAFCEASYPRIRAIFQEAMSKSPVIPTA